MNASDLFLTALYTWLRAHPAASLDDFIEAADRLRRRSIVAMQRARRRFIDDRRELKK